MKQLSLKAAISAKKLGEDEEEEEKKQEKPKARANKSNNMFTCVTSRTQVEADDSAIDNPQSGALMISQSSSLLKKKFNTPPIDPKLMCERIQAKVSNFNCSSENS